MITQAAVWKLAGLIAWCVISIPVGLVWLGHEVRCLRARRRSEARRGYLDPWGPR